MLIEMTVYSPKSGRSSVSRPYNVLLFTNKISLSYKGSCSVDTLRIMTAAKIEEYQTKEAERTGRICSTIHQRGFQVFMLLLLVLVISGVKVCLLLL